MDTTQFWKLIEQSKQGAADCEGQARRLTKLLEDFTPDEIYDFDRHMGKRRIESYRWDLWAVAYIINGGCSNDGFEYFRCWLIAQGQAVFERALGSPESVADHVRDDEVLECEAILYSADHAYENVTGREMPATEIEYPSEPAGKRWEPNELEHLYPNLCERF
jgi:hypothetical protein